MNLVKKSESFKLVIPKEVEEKIRYICQQIWQDEWSGILFYKPEGTFEDSNLIIRCVDIFVMDIGNATYTEFEMSPDVIHYMSENPELLECQTGLCHSHNNMPTFFSGTDTSTLKEEGLDRNHFVSLIVNNRGLYTAAITRRVKVAGRIAETISYNSFNDEEKRSVDTLETEDERIEYFNLDIEFEGGTSIDNSLLTRLDDIRKSKEEAKRLKPVTSPYSYGYSKPYIHTSSQVNKKYEDSFFTESTPKQEEDIPDMMEEDYGIPYDMYHINPVAIKSIMLQLITGSIIISNENKIDAIKWANGMVPLFEKRFGKGEEGMLLFSDWADTCIDFLTWNINATNLEKEGITKDEIQSICAHDLIEALNKLPQNVYIRKFINILNKYIYE